MHDMHTSSYSWSTVSLHAISCAIQLSSRYILVKYVSCKVAFVSHTQASWPADILAQVH